MKTPLKAHIFDRAANEYYVEPRLVSRALFRNEYFQGDIWDPACGRGNILSSAVETGRHVIGTDIASRGWVGERRGDFFHYDRCLAANIVTNPPFGRAILAEKFIRHAISLKPQKLAVFLDSRFLFGKARATGLFAELPPTHVWLITPRPSCPPGEYLEAGNKAGGGTADYVWLVYSSPFENRHTELRWLSCNV